MKKYLFGFFTLLYMGQLFAQHKRDVQHQGYVVINAGVFRGGFNNSYTDTTDVVPVNASGSSLTQNGATGGFGLGYIAILKNRYLLGAEVVQNFNSQRVRFSIGSSDTVLCDTQAIRNNLAILFKPGIKITDFFDVYLNGGLSFGYLKNRLISQLDFIGPNYETHCKSQYLAGFVLGVGARAYLCKRISIFTEYNYRDYGTAKLPNFQNLTATYTHTDRITSMALTIGSAWHF